MRNTRKSPRASWLDYERGIYFITVCTRNMVHYLGEIKGGIMHLSNIGRYLDETMSCSNGHKGQDVHVISYVIMPNHTHALVKLNSGDDVEHLNYMDHRNPNPSMRPDAELSRHIPTLSKFVNQLKGSVTRKAIRERIAFAWQPRYHDHWVRNSNEFYRILDYINNNVARWELDCFYKRL